MPSSIVALYAARAASGEIERDPAQEVRSRRARRAQRAAGELSAGPQILLARAGCSAIASAEEPLKGLYIYGEVGRGKTMLMDLFFAACPVAAQAARAFPRIHGRRA